MKGLLLALLAALAFAGWQSWRLANEQRAHSETNLAHARKLIAMADAAITGEQNARTEEQRRVAALQEIANDTAQALAQVRKDAAAADAVAQRLRRQLATFAARGREGGGDPAPGPGSPAAGDPIGVLADVLGRADRRAGILAEYADAARTAGRACERAYDSLTIAPPNYGLQLPSSKTPVFGGIGSPVGLPLAPAGAGGVSSQ